jgi:hypothetical protein
LQSGQSEKIGRKSTGDPSSTFAIPLRQAVFAMLWQALPSTKLPRMPCSASTRPRSCSIFAALQVDPAVVAVASQRGHERADHMIAAYLAKMGIGAGLLGLASSVRFEDLHVLTREEIARFGLDRREFVEAPWKFESNGLRRMHKIAVVRGVGETSFRMLQLPIACFDANRFAVEFQRPALPSASFASVSMAGLDAKPLYFIHPPLKASGFEHWGLAMGRPALQRFWIGRKPSLPRSWTARSENHQNLQTGGPVR